MESEEFYDSLDESSDYENCSCPRPKQFLFSTKSEDITDNLIPFYEENLNLSQISIKKNSSSNSGFLAQNRNTSKSNITIVPAPKPKKSYLEMFYDRTKVNKKYEVDGVNEYVSSRPTCSSLSPKSYITCDGDVEGDNVTTIDLKSISGASLENSKVVSATLVPELNLQIDKGKGDHKLYSVSDQNMDNILTPTFNYSYIQKKPSVTMETKATDTRTERLELTVSKLEVWKKRQQYGMMASQSNRIKMQEKKALQTLEKELRNSNRVCL